MFISAAYLKLDLYDFLTGLLYWNEAYVRMDLVSGAKNMCIYSTQGFEICAFNEELVQKQAWWYLRAAEGGSSRAMYNVALCFRTGEGITRNYNEAKRWMRRAAMAGHRKAQFEHGLTLFAVSYSSPQVLS